MEIFKEIEYKGIIFNVSNMGRVFLNGVERKQNVNADGYKVIPFVAIDKKCRNVGVHRLVAFAFIDNDDPEVKNEVNHLDYDRQNNVVTNLEWLSHADNVRYSVCNKKDISGKNNPNYGNKKLSEFYSKNKDVALIKQSSKGLQNGRCRKIDLYKHGIFIKSFDYISLCCRYFQELGLSGAGIESIRSQINEAIRENRTYKDYTFIKH